MSALLKKRGREYVEAPLDSTKRFCGETEQQILQLLEDGDEIQKEEDCGASEELVSGVMRSLEEEIGVNQESGLCSDNSMASNMTSGLRTAHGSNPGDIDLDYLLGASDDELGIPPSPVLNLEDQAAASVKQPFSESVPSLDFAVNPELNVFCDNWHFDEDLVDCGQFSVFEDAAAALDLVSHGTLFDGDYSAVWKLETACGLY